MLDLQIDGVGVVAGAARGVLAFGVQDGRVRSNFFLGELFHFFCARDTIQAPGKAKITNLYCTVIIDEDVLRFQVAVADVGLVKVQQAAQNVVNDAFALDFLEVLIRLQKLLHVHVALVQHHVGIFHLVDVAWRKHRHQLVEAWVLNFLQYR